MPRYGEYRAILPIRRGCSNQICRSSFRSVFPIGFRITVPQRLTFQLFTIELISMDHLSGVDYVSLLAERGNIYNHVATLIIYDASTAPGGKVRHKDILKHFEERLYLHPVFRRKLVMPPLSIDRPFWLAEGQIDIEFHIRHIALPEPGDWRQLMIQVARLHSRPLDRAHPLWEAYIIEGLDNIPNLPPGAFAIFLKIHHAVVDGMAAVHLIEQLHAGLPEDLGVKSLPTVVIDRMPATLEVAASAVTHAMQRTGKFARLAGSLAKRSLAAGTRIVQQAAAERRLPSLAQLQGEKTPVPKTRFSGRVSPNRVAEGFGMPLSRIKRIRSKVPGATLNDIFIAVAGGGVRRYLESKHELPGESLMALMPISLRTDASAGGNDVAGVPVSVCSNIADPLERLRAAHNAAIEGKAKGEAMGLDMLKNLFEVLPPRVINLVVDKVLIPSINMTVSNVRGPDKPMYLAGAKAMCLYPISIPADGGGLNITGVSYNGVMWVSAVSCRSMMPDPEFFISCMRDAWLELLAAADALPSVVAPEGKSQTRTRRAAKNSSAK